ncbi:hypothetical protein ABPG72_004009 [Tetrahymena utriculariae]
MEKKENAFHLFLIIALFFFLGSFIYLYGFLSTSTISANHSPKGNPYVKEMQFKNKLQREIYEKQWFPTQTSQLIFLIIDSLPHYYVINEQEQQKKAEKMKNGQNKNSKTQSLSRDVPFPQFVDRLINEPENSVLLKAYSHPPTYTTLRIKAMLQGILPSYDQLTSNLGSKQLKADNIFYQAKQNNPFQGQKRQKILCFGSLFINQLYPNTFDRGSFVGETSFYEREKYDIQQFQKIVPEQMQNDDWSAMLIHFDGVDAASHISSSLDEAFKKTITNVNGLVKDLIQNIKDSEVNTDQTLIAVSDHGINYDVLGHHGGYTALECNSFMFGYSKHKFISKEKKDIGQDMDRRFHAEPEVFQINTTPTYCMLLGIPIPANNLGMIQPDFFLDKPDVDDFVIANNYYTNFRQVEDNFLEKIQSFTGQILETAKIQGTASKIRQKYNSLFSGKEGSKNRKVDLVGLKQLVDLCQLYSAQVINCIQKELQGINIQYMWIGLLIHIALALVVLTAIVQMKLLTTISDSEILIYFDEITDLVFKSKIFLVSLAISSFVMSFFVHITTFVLVDAILIFVLLVTILCFMGKILKNLTKASSQQLKQQIDSVFFLDVTIFVTSAAFVTLTRTSNDYFDFYIDIFTAYFLIISVAFGILYYFKKSTCKLDQNITFFNFTAKIVAINALLYICDYYNANAKTRYNTPPIYYQEFLEMPALQHYIPLLIFITFFNTLFLKIWQKMKVDLNMTKKVLFLYLHGAQIASICIYYLCEWHLIQIQHYPTIFPTIALFHTILIEVFKNFVYSEPQNQRISLTLKTVYFLVNISVGLSCILEGNCLIQLPCFFVIVYLICSVLIDLDAISIVSITCILFYLSQFFFQLSGHLEYLEEIHADVFQIGVLFQKFLLFPIFNGVVNTLYYLFVTPAILPIFIMLIKSNIQTIRQNGLFNYILVQNEQEESKSDLQNIGGEQKANTHEEIIDYQQNGETNTQQLPKDLVNEYHNLSIFFFYSIAFLSHVIIGALGADLRNIVKPKDTNKENMYVPNYLFQMTYVFTYFIVICLNYAFQKEKKDKKSYTYYYSKLEQSEEQ